MKDIKSIVAKNITELRISNKMTQFELAEKLNYSDKAVSKWERAESLPDLSVLAEIADLFGVTLDYLVKPEHKNGEKILTSKKVLKYSRTIITMVSILCVWFVALLGFVLVTLIFPNCKNEWLSFIYAIPATAIVWLVLNSVWFDKRWNYLIISILMWSSLVSIQVTVYLFMIDISLIYL